MRAMTRQELAVRAGVDRKTLYNYFERHKEELWSLGVRPNQIVPPCAVEWLSDNYGINIDDWEWERWGRTGKNGEVPFPIFVILQVLRQVSQRDDAFDPFRRLFPSVPTSSTTCSDDTLGG